MGGISSHNHHRRRLLPESGEIILCGDTVEFSLTVVRGKKCAENSVSLLLVEADCAPRG